MYYCIYSVYLHHQSITKAKIGDRDELSNNTNILKFTVMARNYETALAELNSSNAELAEIEAMTDEKTCYIYNVYSNSENVKIISEDIEALEREVEYLTPEIYEPEYDY